jgi:hypothetical protein
LTTIKKYSIIRVVKRLKEIEGVKMKTKDILKVVREEGLKLSNREFKDVLETLSINTVLSIDYSYIGDIAYIDSSSDSYPNEDFLSEENLKELEELYTLSVVVVVEDREVILYKVSKDNFLLYIEGTDRAEESLIFFKIIVDND